MQTCYPEDFNPLLRKQLRFDRFTTFVAVAGLDEDDLDRVTLSYTFGTGEIILNFPTLKRMNAGSRRMLGTFRKQLGV